MNAFTLSRYCGVPAIALALGLAASGAGAQTLAGIAFDPGRSIAVLSATGQPPLRLVRPIAPETIERAQREAEALYRSTQSAPALHAYATLVELDPGLTFAWLRLGNLHQQAGREEEALDAYRQAALGPGSMSTDRESRGKALMNMALLTVAQAGRALDALEMLDVSAFEGQEAAREAAARALSQQRSRLQIRSPVSNSTRP